MNINNNLIWDNIDWNEINLFINKIQSRIVKASLVNVNIFLYKKWKIIMYNNQNLHLSQRAF